MHFPRVNTTFVVKKTEAAVTTSSGRRVQRPQRADGAMPEEGQRRETRRRVRIAVCYPSLDFKLCVPSRFAEKSIVCFECLCVQRISSIHFIFFLTFTEFNCTVVKDAFWAFFQDNDESSAAEMRSPDTGDDDTDVPGPSTCDVTHVKKPARPRQKKGSLTLVAEVCEGCWEVATNFRKFPRLIPGVDANNRTTPISLYCPARRPCRLLSPRPWVVLGEGWGIEFISDKFKDETQVCVEFILFQSYAQQIFFAA